MAREVFVDAGAWIAIAVTGDDHHGAAVGYYQQLLRQPDNLVTTNLVIAEAYVGIHRAGGHSRAMIFLTSLGQSNRLVKVFSDADLEAQAELILARYSDHDLSFADAVSFAVMRQRDITDAFAFDRHFLTAGFALRPARS